MPERPALALFAPTAAHHDEVASLLRRVYAEYGQVLELDTLDADLTDLARSYRAPSAFRVRLVDGRVVGTVACKLRPRPADAPEAELKRLFLDAGRRGSGEGRALCEWAIEHARRSGATALEIWTDVLFEDAHRLYERLGAVDTGARRALGGRNAIEERHYRLALR